MNSVCIATYNGGKFIKEQLESILIQLNVDDEVIISDDSSTDDTISIIDSLQDERIKIYVNENSSGRPTENFQNALYKARGEIIFLSDQDDIWLQNKYQKMVEVLHNCDLVLSNSKLVNDRLEVLHNSFFHYHGSSKGVLRNIIKNSYFGSCMAFKKSVLNFALPFPPSREIGHDVWIGLVAEITGKVCFYGEPLILYRRHESAVTSHGMAKSTRSLFVKVLGRVIMLLYVIMFYIKYLLEWKRV